ncbi:MAG: MBG domain-containing protein, partial [Bacillota bacterium]|nr:MBG domain-containing protein [Bacillota bacterium]
ITCGSVKVGGNISASTISTTTLTSEIMNLTLSGNLSLSSRSTSLYAPTNNATFALKKGYVKVAGSVEFSNESANNVTHFLMTSSYATTLELQGGTPFKNLNYAGSFDLQCDGNKATVIYSGADQPIWRATYYNLILSGSGQKNWDVLPIYINGNLSIHSGVVANLRCSSYTSNVGSLTLGGLGQAAGTWGASTSPADHKNDIYFNPVYTGILSVSKNTGPDAAKSTLTPVSSSITADGISTQVLTVQVKDSSGNNITTGGATVTITKDSGTGTIGSVTDHANGTYTATVTAATEAGSGVFVAAIDGQPVQSGSSSQTQVTVNYVPTTIEVTVIVTLGQSKIYGSADPVLEYTCIPSDAALTGSLARATGENIGSYAINQGTLVGTGNYVIKTFTGADFTITTRPVKVTADAKSKVYGDSDPALTYQVTSGTLAAGDSFTGSLSRVAGNDVGTYAIGQGTLALNSNYSLSYVGADLTITTRPVKVTADAKSKVYGDSDPALTYQVTSGTLAAGDSFTGSLSRVAGNDVGTYAIEQGTLALNSNYSLSYVG